MLALLIFVHVSLGSIAVLGMLTAWATKKGSLWHRRGGKAYVLGMAGALIAAFSVSIATQNLFLFLIGVFSAYLVFTGYRLAVVKHGVQSLFDKTVVALMLMAGLGMLGYAASIFSNNSSTAIVLLVLGIIAAGQALSDARRGGRWPTGTERIVLHLTRMGGASIATVTAVFVVNVKTDPAFIAWLLPTVVGSIIMSYWTKQVSNPVGEEAKSARYQNP